MVDPHTGAQDVNSPATWDSRMTEHPHGHLLQSWCWGELKARFGWRAVRLAVPGELRRFSSDGSQPASALWDIYLVGQRCL